MTKRRINRDEEIQREILSCVDERADLSQRMLARDLGIALGLVNAHLRRGIDAGLVAVTKGPGRHYRYALTAKGVAEKIRLGGRHFKSSFDLFRHVRDSFDRLYADLAERGVQSVVLCGIDELTEIALLCALDTGVTPSGIWRHAGRPMWLRGVPGVVLSEAARADAVVVSVERNVQYVYHALRRRVPPERIAVPDIIDLRPVASDGKAIG